MKTTKFILSALIVAAVTVGCSSSKKTASAETDSTQQSRETNSGTTETTIEKSTNTVDEKTKQQEKMLADAVASYPDSLVAMLQRTACHGTCPIYQVKVYKSGYTEYSGKNFVEKMGTHTTKLESKEIDGIVKKASEVKFFEKNNIYDTNVQDLPSFHIYVNNSSAKKQVLIRHQYPEELKQFGDYLDTLFNSATWTKAE